MCPESSKQLPISEAPPTLSPGPDSLVPAAAPRPERVLLVDDDELVRQGMARTLRQFGFDVVPCRDAEEAIVEASQSKFDALVTDLVLPGLDGVDLIERLQALGRQIPVVLVSGYSDAQRPVAGLAAGAACFITKPVPPQLLAMTLERAIRRAQS